MVDYLEALLEDLVDEQTAELEWFALHGMGAAGRAEMLSPPQAEGASVAGVETSAAQAAGAAVEIERVPLAGVPAARLEETAAVPLGAAGAPEGPAAGTDGPPLGFAMAATAVEIAAEAANRRQGLIDGLAGRERTDAPLWNGGAGGGEPVMGDTAAAESGSGGAAWLYRQVRQSAVQAGYSRQETAVIPLAAVPEPNRGAALSPEGLDRFFQQDARRYDTGFTLF